MATAQKPTFETVWAALQETDRIVKENALLIRELREQSKKTDRQMKETDRQLRKQMGETDKRLGELGNRFGELAEHLVAPGVAARFNELGYHFDEVMPGGTEIKNEKGKILAEIDLLLENGDCVMAVEVKAVPKEEDIEHHIKRLEILQKSRRKRGDMRKIRGAIAGAIFGRKEKQAFTKAGFYTLVQSGDTMKIEIPDGFVPREW